MPALGLELLPCGPELLALLEDLPARGALRRDLLEQLRALALLGAQLLPLGGHLLLQPGARHALLGDQLRERLQLQALALLRLQQLLLELRRQALFHLPDLILYPGHDGTNRGLPALRYHARRSVPNVLTRALVSPE